MSALPQASLNAASQLSGLAPITSCVVVGLVMMMLCVMMLCVMDDQ